MIENIKAGERMTQAVLLRLQKVGNSSNGGVFARGTVEDNSGKIQFIAFERDIVNRLRDLEAPKAFMISGPVDIVKYSSTLALQVVIQKLDNIMPEDDISNLVPVGGFDLEIYKSKMETLMNSVKTPSLRTLLKKVFSGPFYDAFCKNPAGMKLHHAYLGGLLQHSVDVTELALAMADAIGNTDKDLITAGAMLHDIGKVKEISSGMGFPYTTEGRLLGHITMSVLMVREAAMELKLPATALQQLEHIILSHHGEQEKGSPMACATKEAFIVHYADEVNSIMNQFEVKDSKSNWEFNNMMKRYLMLK
jgi:uncharacterized domain HDIG